MERLAASGSRGAPTQGAASSPAGRFGDKARDYAVGMIERNLAHVLATDGHDVRYRPPILSDGVRAAAALVGDSAALRMVQETPQAILDGKEVEIAESARAPRRGLLDRLRQALSSR